MQSKPLILPLANTFWQKLLNLAALFLGLVIILILAVTAFVNPVIFCFFLVHGFVSIFWHSSMLHRYGAHGQFTFTNKKVEQVCYVMTWLSMGPSYLHAYGYALLHLAHHKFSDQEKDIHSPCILQDVFYLMLHTRNVYNQLIVEGKNITNSEFKIIVEEYRQKHGKDIPHWSLDWVADHVMTKIGFGIIFLSIYLLCGATWYMYLFLWPTQFLMGSVQGALVNWFGHHTGFRNYDTDDESRNTPLLNILLGGEVNQNNHHHNPDKANFGEKLHEFDWIYWILRIFHKAKIIVLKSPQP